jgi:transglutaminase-like putative cysteine protease
MKISDLQETFYCDFGHPAIKELADKIAGEETDWRKITEATFNYVRNNIRFGCDLVKIKASETLTKGYGVCWNKALLLVALLRCKGIPARMGYHESDEEKKGIILDYTADGQIAGIEVLNASKRVGNPSKVEYEVAL